MSDAPKPDDTPAPEPKIDANGVGLCHAGRVLECCEAISAADQRAMATDGPVEPTARMMSDSDLASCLDVLWLSQDTARAVLAAEAAMVKREAEVKRDVTALTVELSDITRGVGDARQDSH